tara:strand:- start:353 stop:784 length:432 start_codon:yes stop_codon:yes gene_type:complete
MLRDNLIKTCSCGKSIKKIMENEIFYLKKIEKYKYFPKLIDYNYDSNYIIMEYCKETISNAKKIPDNYMKQIKEICEIFEKENIHHGDLSAGNVCLKENTIIIIDFGCVQKLDKLKNERIYNLKYKNYDTLVNLFTELLKKNK